MSPRPVPIFHLTHGKNLRGIIADGALFAVGHLAAATSPPISIAHQNIQDRRATTCVPCGAGGILHDYVPFYFAPRSPMLYAIQCGQVQGVTAAQEPLVYLVSTVQAVEAAGLPFVFTNGHAIMALSEFFDDLAHLDRVDWPLMRAKMWNNTSTDGDRKRRRSAEFLVHRRFPWTLVHEVAVMTPRSEAVAWAALARAGHIPRVQVRRNWYF